MPLLNLHPNLILNALSAKSRGSLVSKCRTVPMPCRKVLFEPETMPKYAYFITSGLASVATMIPNGGAVEVGLIGHEGVVGALHLLGGGVISTSCFMQIEGSALRIRLADLRAAYEDTKEIRERLLEFVQNQTSCIEQIAACNRLHAAEARLARWLLMAQDRIGSDMLHITQELLAEMLGLRRTTVTVVAGDLQRNGTIEYHRGHVRIVDRGRLEMAACSCYAIVHELFARLYCGGATGLVGAVTEAPGSGDSTNHASVAEAVPGGGHS